MNGIHDMGGMQGFGRVQIEPDEALFHTPWESRAMAITVAMGASGQWNIDLSRSARESLPPPVYLSSSYYEIWIHASVIASNKVSVFGAGSGTLYYQQVQITGQA